MSEEIKGVFIKQMLLPKEELALQTMELMADKMELEKQVEQLENIINEAKEECKSVIEDSEHTTVSEFNINGLIRTISNILNK